MRRLIVLLGVVLALAVSSAASADTFRIVGSKPSGGGATVAFASGGAQSGGRSFGALLPIWQAAGDTYGIPWQVLAAINKVETNFGQNLGPSSAGAVGWMQFMPSTWARWGTDANGDGIADPDNPTDAIFSAARYLAGCGGQFDIARAVYCYNHASWYVSEVLGLAAQYGQGGGSDALVSSGASQAELDADRTQIVKAKQGLDTALARARKLADVEHHFLHLAQSAPLFSDQLEARKRAVQVGVRRQAAARRASHLRGLLRSATERLSNAQNQVTVTSMPFAPTAGGLKVGRIDQGVDYTSTAPYAAVAAGVVVYIDPNFWQGTPAVYEKLDRPIVVGGHRYDEIYYSETQALVRVGQRLVPGEAVIGPGSAELGFAEGELPAAHNLYHEGDQTSAGQDFYRWMSAGHQVSAAAPAQFSVVSGASFDTFSSGGGNAFTSDVVYFTH